MCVCVSARVRASMRACVRVCLCFFVCVWANVLNVYYVYILVLIITSSYVCCCTNAIDFLWWCIGHVPCFMISYFHVLFFPQLILSLVLVFVEHCIMYHCCNLWSALSQRQGAIEKMSTYLFVPIPSLRSVQMLRCKQLQCLFDWQIRPALLIEDGFWSVAFFSAPHSFRLIDGIVSIVFGVSIM